MYIYSRITCTSSNRRTNLSAINFRVVFQWRSAPWLDWYSANRPLLSSRNGRPGSP